MQTKSISPSSEWVPGQRYILTWSVEGAQFAGNARVNAFMAKVAEDPKLRLERYKYENGLIEAQVLAISEGSPIHAVVAGLIALAILFSLFLTLREVKQVLDPDIELELPGGVKAKISVLQIALALGGILAVVYGFRRLSK